MSKREHAQRTSSLIDVHHHMIPPAYVAALREAGRDITGFPSWTPEQSIELMGRLGIDKAILSISSPGVWFGDVDNGPTKSYMIDNRDAEAEHRRLYELAFEKRPAEELYNLTNDIGEEHNLAASQPEKAAELHALLQDWRIRIEAKIPELNPAYSAEGTTT